MRFLENCRLKVFAYSHHWRSLIKTEGLMLWGWECILIRLDGKKLLSLLWKTRSEISGGLHWRQVFVMFFTDWRLVRLWPEEEIEVFQTNRLQCDWILKWFWWRGRCSTMDQLVRTIMVSSLPHNYQRDRALWFGIDGRVAKWRIDLVWILLARLFGFTS